MHQRRGDVVAGTAHIDDFAAGKERRQPVDHENIIGRFIAQDRLVAVVELCEQDPDGERD